MNTFTRAFGRLAAPLILALVVSALFAASASAINVKLRIEGSAGTVFNGNVNTGPRTVKTTNKADCSVDGSSVTTTFATPVTALAAWADANSVTYNTRYGGTFLCQVGADIGGDNDYWLLKINERAAPPPVGYVTGGDELHEGDSVLFYWTDDFAKKTLQLALPSVATVGVPIAGNVSKWDGSDDTKTDAAGATVSGGSASAATDSDGKFNITFPSVGTYVVNATQSGTIRGSAVVTVGTEPVPLIVVTNRFVKCADTYKKSSKKYKRCIRIVRAKQAAAKKKS